MGMLGVSTVGHMRACEVLSQNQTSCDSWLEGFGTLGVGRREETVQISVNNISPVAASKIDGSHTKKVVALILQASSDLLVCVIHGGRPTCRVRGDLVSRLITPIAHTVSLIIPIIGFRVSGHQRFDERPTPQRPTTPSPRTFTPWL